MKILLPPKINDDLCGYSIVFIKLLVATHEQEAEIEFLAEEYCLFNGCQLLNGVAGASKNNATVKVEKG